MLYQLSRERPGAERTLRRRVCGAAQHPAVFRRKSGRDGEQLSTGKINNDPIAMAAAMAPAGPIPMSSSKPRMAGNGRRMCSIG